MNQEIKNHYGKIQNVLLNVLWLNLVVTIAKIIYGFLCGSASMIADGFHSLSDSTSNIIGLIGVKISSQPVDDDHPYGHKKYETLFSLGIAVMLMIVTYNFIIEGVKRIFHPQVPNITTQSFVVMTVTIVINIFVMIYERNQGKRLKSDILVVDAMHTRADVFTSFSVIVALISTSLGFPMVDAIVTIMIALFIGYTGFMILKEQSAVLCDAVAIADIKKIENIVLSVKGVKGCHKIRSRGRNDDIHIDLHVQLSPSTHLDKAHNTSYAIETAIKTQIPEVTDVLVHIEPEE